jgi:release factor glutamine methyltransferase
LAQRLQGRPIAHITGRREFWSREFQVTPEVLIPRPETELLVELALARIQPEQTARIADLGTGSGAVAITLALERPKASVTALDLSPAALRIAEANAARLGAGNVRFVESDWFAALPAAESFDLIVSNPPYIAESDPHLGLGDVRFEPPMALASGPDGLDAIRHIVGQALARLNPGGWLLFEHGYDQSAAAQGLLKAAGFQAVGSFADLQGHLRVSGGCAA